MKKLFPLFLAMLLCSYGSRGQNFERLEWSRVRMDSTWNAPEGRAAEIIGKYRPTIDSLLIPIGRTADEMESYAPESPLSNLAADIMFEFASDYLKKSTGERDAEVDMAMTNFGGIRASLPGGDVTAYDVMSIFPFDNKIVILDLEGRYVRELLENFARRERVEALSGVRLVIENRELKKALVAGEEIDDGRIYKVATIDFLLFGGSNAEAFKKCGSYVDTGVFMRDMVTDYIKDKTAAGMMIESGKDGRTVVIKAEEQ